MAMSSLELAIVVATSSVVAVELGGQGAALR